MKKIFHILAVIGLLLNALSAISQELISSEDYLVNGFDKKIAGDDYSYHSSIPEVEQSLIVRATDGNYSMQWQTEKVPLKVEEKYITFVWLAGIGSSPGLSDMTLTINGREKITFRTDGKREWKIDSPQGSQLFFHSDTEDQFGDQFGFMFLRIPSAKVEKGKPYQLTMTGGKDNKTSWYMTFQMPVRSGLTLRPFPALIKEGGQSRQLVSGNILYFGLPEKAQIFVEGKLIKEQELKFGANYLRLGLPAVSHKKTVTLKLEAGSYSQQVQLEQFPVRQWQVNLVQHSHTDIGYTRSQSEILAEHLRYIDYALDYCDATDSYPDAAKFRWTCEASWAVDEFLKCRPAAQIERFKRRVKEGRIEIAAMYFNFDELPDEQTLAASLQPLKRFAQNGLHPEMAMQNDVNGIGWCMNDFYHDLGVKYLNMGTHGHRALISFDKPTLFWWESPSGNRMLAYRGEHYMTGNTVFDIQKGDLPNFEVKLLNYLISLADKGYQYDEISIQHSGYLTDNSPPSTIASEVIRQWNDKYEWPKLKTATATSFFKEMEGKYAASFPVYRGAWPDWWTDGFGASAREVAAARKAQSEITATSSGLAMAQLQGAELPKNIGERIQLVNDALLFYTEHTVGYSESVREPYHEQTMEQRAIKESYAWEAYRRTKMVEEETMGQLQSYIQNEAKPSLLVFNTLNWNREGLLTVYIDHQLVPRGTYPKLTDQAGNVYPVQALSHRSDGTYWAVWVKDIPAFGYRKLLIEPVEGVQEQSVKSITPQMENKWYRVQIDAKRGVITSWFDKQMNKELIDPSAKYGMGEFIYERLGNRYQMEQKRLDDFKRYPLDSAWFDSYTQGPVWNTIHLKGRTAASYEGYDVDIEIRLFNTSRRMDMAYSIVKKPIVDPEGIYIAFPFQLDQGKHFFEVQGGVVEAGKDQIPGSSNDWNTIQHFSSVRNDQVQIVIGSPEIPLVQLGNINTGRYKAGALPETTHLFSWPMNNYWVTNFNPDQKGQHQWTYYLTSGEGDLNLQATRFGWGARTPFLTRVLPGGGKGDQQWQKSLISGWPENIILVNAQPVEQERAVIIQVREISDKMADMASLKQDSGKPLSVTQVSATGETLAGGSAVLKPYGSGFFKLSW
ncbi:MAG: glycoside hydrolase family 38 C-terminal domain-containing protein [Candidatus Saccharibacteria bacterium]